MPISGAAPIAQSERSVTSNTRSAASPSTTSRLPISTSSTSTRLCSVGTIGDRPSLTLRSISGTARWRTSIMPMTCGGALGRRTTGPSSMISCTWVTSTANTSSPTPRVTYCMPGVMPSRMSGRLQLVFERLPVIQQPRHIEDQRDPAIAEDGGAGKGRDIGMQLGERFDHRLMAAQQLVDHQPEAEIAARDHHHLLIGIGIALDVEQRAQAHERHQIAAYIEEI